MKYEFEKISQALEKAFREGRNSLSETQVYEILAGLGLNVPTYSFFPKSRGNFAEASAKIQSRKAAVKIVSHKTIHKTETGGVKIVENEPAALERTAGEMTEKFKDISGILVSEFVEHSPFALGEELMLGARSDDSFGPIITFGAGGTHAEEMAKSVKAGLLPDIAAVDLIKDDSDWNDFLAASWTWKYVSGGIRGGKRLAGEDEIKKWLKAFAAVMKRYPQKAGDFEIVEFEINPLAVSRGKIVALDGVLRFKKAGKNRRILPSRKAVESILRPESVVLAGVSEKKMNMGRIVLKNVLNAGFNKEKTGVLKDYDGEIEGVKCFKSVKEFPGKIDMFVVAVPSEAALEVLGEAAQSGKVNGVVLISGGMGEKSGSEGLAKKVEDIVRAGREKNPDFALSGGNSLGIVLRESRVNTLFIPEYKMPYPLRENPNIAKTAFISQSGAFVISVLSKMPWLMPAYSITVGNQQDITVTDYVETIVEKDDGVEVLLIYIEGFKPGDGARLARIAKKASAKGKKVVLYKAGRTSAGRKAVMGHTASIAGDYTAAKKILQKAGALVADTFDDFSDFAMLACHLSPFKIRSEKVFMMSNAGFETAGMADSAGENIPAEIRDERMDGRAEEILGKYRLDAIVDFKNPLDVTPMAADAPIGEIAAAALNSPETGAVIVSMIPLTPAMNTLPKSEKYPDDLEKSFLAKAAGEMKKTGKPLIFCVACGALYEPYVKHALNLGIPTFRSADRAVRVYFRYLKHLGHLDNSPKKREGVNPEVSVETSGKDEE